MSSSGGPPEKTKPGGRYRNPDVPLVVPSPESRDPENANLYLSMDRGLEPQPLTPRQIEIARCACDLMADGASLAEIARVPGMPVMSTLRRLMAHPSIAASYARARDLWADAEADALVAYAMAPLSEGEDSTIRRTAVAVRQWRLAKQMPRKYGERLELSGSGGAALGAVTIVLAGTNPVLPSANPVIEAHPEPEEEA